jgi:hypothetical protein
MLKWNQHSIMVLTGDKCYWPAPPPFEDNDTIYVRVKVTQIWLCQGCNCSSYLGTISYSLTSRWMMNVTMVTPATTKSAKLHYCIRSGHSEPSRVLMHKCLDYGI